MLFSDKLVSEEMIVEEFLPALVALDDSSWHIMRSAAVHMLAMLVDKMKKRGLALVSANLPSNVSSLFLFMTMHKIYN